MYYGDTYIVLTAFNLLNCLMNILIYMTYIYIYSVTHMCTPHAHTHSLPTQQMHTHAPRRWMHSASFPGHKRSGSKGRDH